MNGFILLTGSSNQLLLSWGVLNIVDQRNILIFFSKTFLLVLWYWRNKAPWFLSITLEFWPSFTKCQLISKVFFWNSIAPKNEWNIRQNSTLSSYGRMFSNISFGFFDRSMKFQKKSFWDLLTFNLVRVNTHFWNWWLDPMSMTNAP